MATRPPRQIEDDAPEGAPAWMTTFSDCMMLLLTFFVLLLSFSSFDKAELRQLLGAMKFRPHPNLATEKWRRDGRLASRVKSEVDRTDKGSEFPDDERRTERVANPRKPDVILDTDTYRDRKVLYIPRDRLFAGRGVFLKQDSQRRSLEKIALHMKSLPCTAIISEVGPDILGAEEEGSADRALHRAWTVVSFFTGKQGLSAERFSIAPRGTLSAKGLRREPYMRIILLARDITR
jgi:hypothetical protein